MNRIVLALTVAFLMGGVYAADNIPLEAEELYCNRYGISFWCSEEGIEFLEDLPADVLAEQGYINEYAFSDAVRYNGEVKIIDIEVIANLDRTSATEATYRLYNSGSDTEHLHLTALATPEGTELYVGGARVDTDPLIPGWDVTLDPEQTIEITLIFKEALYGNIYGYNINLLLNNKTTDNHITQVGTYEFKMPVGVKSVSCAPDGYTTKTEGNRTAIIWQKRDFVSWTNPFNDLVCIWSYDEDLDLIVLPEEPTEGGGGSDWIIWVVLILIILGGLYYAKDRGLLERFGIE